MMSDSSETLVKCLVWDLDDTVWDGVLLEGDQPQPRPGVVQALEALDQRGILQAVASRGEYEAAEEHLRDLGLLDYFVHLEVSWGAKSEALRGVAEQLGIGVDTLGFIDNDPSELAEVRSSLATVRCYPHDAVDTLADLPEFRPAVVTEDARNRRAMYIAERTRRQHEEQSGTHPTEFLAGLDLQMTIRQATAADLARAHELTVRTHQLNSTGRTYSMDELGQLCESADHEVLVSSLDDRYGSYGTIGLSVTETRGSDQVLRLLLMSCRVVSRGVGGVLLHQIVSRARAAGRRPCAEFVPTPVNRMMLVTLRFAGFVQVDESDGVLLLAQEKDTSPDPPAHVRVVTETPATTSATSTVSVEQVGRP